MSESIKDIADEIGVSKTAIRKRMTDEFRKTRTEKQGNKILITDEGVAELKEQFKASGITEQDTTEDDDQEDLTRQELGVLSEQLTSQSDQLKEKDRQIAELHKLLDQSQQLQLDVQQRMKQLETSKTKVQAIETNDQSQTESETKPGKVKLEAQSESANEDSINPLPPRGEDNPNPNNKKRRWWPFGRQNK